MPEASDEILCRHGLPLLALRSGRTHPAGRGQDVGPTAAVAFRLAAPTGVSQCASVARFSRGNLTGATRCLLECDVGRLVRWNACHGRSTAGRGDDRSGTPQCPALGDSRHTQSGCSSRCFRTCTWGERISHLRQPPRRPRKCGRTESTSALTRRSAAVLEMVRHEAAAAGPWSNRSDDSGAASTETRTWNHPMEWPPLGLPAPEPLRFSSASTCRRSVFPRAVWGSSGSASSRSGIFHGASLVRSA